MPLRESGQMGDDVAKAEAGRHAHSQQPAQLAAFANAVLSFVQGCEDGLDPGQKLLERLLPGMSAVTSIHTDQAGADERK